MELGAAVWSGLVAAAAMSIFYSMSQGLRLPKIDVPAILGTVVAEPGTWAARWGILLHFAAGAAFGLLYVLLWQAGIGDIDYVWGIAFGVVHGVLSVFLIPFLNQRHPHAELVAPPSTPATMISVVAGHAVFGLAVALQYGALV